MLLEVEFVWCKRSKYLIKREKCYLKWSLSDVKEVNILLREKMLLEVEFVWCKRSKYLIKREKCYLKWSLSDVKEVNILLREKHVTWSGVCLM